MKGAAIRNKIRAVDDIKREKVPVPEWEFGEADALIVRGLSGVARDDWEETMLRRGKAGTTPDIVTRNMRAKLVARCVVDEDDALVFSDDDVEWLGEKSSVALSRIYDVCTKLSGIGAEDEKEIIKNFKRVQGDGSNTVSHLPSDAPAVNS